MILNEKITMRFVLAVYLGGCLLHVFYALLIYDPSVALHTLAATVVWNLPVLLFGIALKNKYMSLILSIPFAVFGIYRIGYIVDTMQYALIVFMIGVTIVSLLFDFKILMYCAALINLEILLVWIAHSDRILNHMSAVTYLLLVIFFETQLLISLLLVFNGAHMIRNLATQEKLLKKAVRSKDDFLANMSHEIRTPMNAVCGMCELILREDGISPSVRENSMNIQSAGRSLLAIINDLLDFSKVESGKMELINEPYNISSVVNDIVNMSIARKGEKKLEIYVDCDPNIPSGLIGDEIRIRQVITNFMTNAIKYTDSGYVYLRVRQRRTKAGLNLQVAVEDTGMGIKPEDCEKLFRTFSQVDTRRNRQKEGTGLGLALCKSLVRQMGGFIQVDSEYGKGSVFRFTIPQKIADESPIIMLDHSEKWNILGYADIRNHSYNDFIQRYYWEVAKKLNVDFTFCHTNEDFHEALKKRDWHYIFVGRDEYAGEAEFFNALAKEKKLILIQDRMQSIPIPPYMGCLYKPLYALSIASVLNGTIVSGGSGDTGDGSASLNFTAPSVKVLVVDDNTTNLKVATGLLRPYQMQVSTADSGKKAIELVESTRFDLILMDHMMPDMDGVEATAVIRGMEGEYFRTVPIIALTANAVSGAKEMFLQNGMQDFISKPIETLTMERVLKKWIPEDKIVKSSDAGRRDASSESGHTTAEGAVSGAEASEAAQNAGISGPAQNAGMSGPAQRAEAASDTTAAELVQLRNISLKEGYKYMGGDKQLYAEVLEDYYRTSPKRKQDIARALEQGNIKDYTTAVHALKSISLSLGITELGNLAKELEFAGKEQNTALIGEKNPLLLSLFEDVLLEVREFLGLEDVLDKEEDLSAKEDIEVDEEQLREALQRALNAVQNFDRDEALEILEEFPAVGKVGAIRQALNDFDYDAAADAIEKALAE